MQIKKEFQPVSLHEIAPYIGRFSAQRAHELVTRYANFGQTVLDPFCGSSVLPLEAAVYGCNVIASDINPYAIVQTKAKLFAPPTLDIALRPLEKFGGVQQNNRSIRNDIPKWVRSFFHPRTIKEIIAYTDYFLERRLYFQLACLLGILHHQRPGFLSYPSSHSTPYLRDKKFPKEKFPELYEYREVRTRLEKKIYRTFRRPPTFDSGLKHLVVHSDIRHLKLKKSIADVCITSPPYMNNLSYGRDNRLRLWFLGVNDWQYFDKCGYNTLIEFTSLMKSFFEKLHSVLVRKGLCVFVVGEARRVNILDVFKTLGEQNGFKVKEEYCEAIPDVRRTRRRLFWNSE